MPQRSIARRRSESGGDITDLIRHAAPVATSFGVARIGSKVLSHPFTNGSQSPLAIRGVPILTSALFVGVAYGLTSLRPLERYRTGALVGALANLLLTIIAQISPTAKSMMGLAGWDYSHVKNPQVASKRSQNQPPQSQGNPGAIAVIEPHEDDNDPDDRLNQGVFGDAQNWSF